MFFWSLKPALEWALILCFALATSLLIAIGGGGILSLFFPMSAFLVGIFLFLRAPILYLGFTWWICFLTPFIRRLADYSSSYTEPSPVLLAPYLVTLVSGITFFQNLPKISRVGGLPFLLACASIFYAMLVGIVSGSVTDSLLDTLQWLTPVFFGFYLYQNWRIYPEFSQNIRTVFIWGVLIMGAYGIYQFIVAPPWDTYWMENIPATSFGSPESLGIRVYSTLNGPFVFALFLLPGLLFLLNYTGPLLYPASAVGYLALLLSRVRTAWGGWVIAAALLFISLKPKFQIQFVLIFLTLAICIVPLTLMDPFAEIISERVETVLTLSDDASGNTRKETYSNLFGIAITQFVGYGMGNLPKFDEPLDSAVLSLLFAFGVFGSLLYLSGLLLILYQITNIPNQSADNFLQASRAYSFSTLPMLVLGPALKGATAIALWGFLGIALAAKKYYLSRQDSPRNNLSDLRLKTTAEQ